MALSVVLPAADGQTPGGPAPDPAAQPEAKATPKTHPNDPTLWDVDTMIEDAVLQVSRRYNLNKQQEKYTQILMKQRVWAFLNKYENDVRELLKESIDFRRRVPSSTELQRWAERARPIYEAAIDDIVSGNQEWGAILSEDQKRIHDIDLKQIEVSKVTVLSTMDLWKEGHGTWPPASTPPPQEGAPAVGGGTGASGVTRPPAPIVSRDIEENWRLYVNAFIKAYGLDAKAQTSALSVLDEIVKRVRDYRLEKKKDFQEVKNALEKDSLDSKFVVERQRMLVKQHLLERPIRKNFLKLKARLEELPTQAQKAALSDMDKKTLEELEKKFRPEEFKAAGPVPGAESAKKAETTGGESETPAKATVQPKAAEKPAADPQPAATSQAASRPSGE